MKIILVHASISACGFDSFGKGDPTETSWIHHGLCSISAYAKREGFDISLIDLRFLKDWDDFKKEFSRLKPDVVGLSMMSVDYNPVMKCINLIKKIKKDIKVVVGGPHPTLMLEEVSSNSDIDHIILGEGEISFTELLKDICTSKTSERVIQGIRPNLDEISFVDRDLYKGQEQPIMKDLLSPFMTIIAGRGCIYNCSFCQPAERILFGKRVRRRSVRNIIKELKFLREKYAFRSLMLHDDCLTEDINWVNEFCEEYKRNEFKQPFVCQSRTDLICRDEKLIKKMVGAGLFMFIIGFESGNQRILNFLRKGATVEQNYEAARICKKYSIEIWANYMLGIPTETKQEAMDTIKMIKEIKPDHRSPAFFTPYPGSDLYEYCLKNKLSLITSHDEYRRNPYGAKIKGIDYNFLNNLLITSLTDRKINKFIAKILSVQMMNNIKNKLQRNDIGRIIITIFKKVFRYGQ